MKDIIEMAKADNRTMRLLKLSEIRHNVAFTNRGELQLILPFEGMAADYWYALDSVKVDAEKNEELMRIYDGVLYKL